MAPFPPLIFWKVDYTLANKPLHKINFNLKVLYNINYGCPTQTGTWPTRLNPNRKLPELTTPTVGDGFPCPRPDVGGSSGGFSSPKPEPPDLIDAIYKFGNIRGDPSEIWWDPATFEEIQARSRSYLVRFDEIWGGLGWFQWFLVQIYWVFAESGDDLVYFCSDIVSFAKIG